MSRYNGWSSYETWAVNMWSENDGLSESFRELARELLSQETDNAVSDLSLHIKDYFYESMPDLDGFWVDMLRASLGSVNWYEFAKHIAQDAMEECE